jgi:hypothetical protein
MRCKKVISPPEPLLDAKFSGWARPPLAPATAGKSAFAMPASRRTGADLSFAKEPNADGRDLAMKRT